MGTRRTRTDCQPNLIAGILLCRIEELSTDQTQHEIRSYGDVHHLRVHEWYTDPIVVEHDAERDAKVPDALECYSSDELCHVRSLPQSMYCRECPRRYVSPCRLCIGFDAPIVVAATIWRMCK
jgi:hypothetical protein